MSAPSVIRTTFLAFALGGVLLSSCSGEDETNPPARAGTAGLGGSGGSGGRNEGGAGKAAGVGGAASGRGGAGGTAAGGESGSEAGSGGSEAGSGGSEAGSGGSEAGSGGSEAGSGGSEAGTASTNAGAGGEGGETVGASAVVTPEDGGTVTDGITTVIVPPGAVSTPTTIRIVGVDSSSVADVPSEFASIGSPVALLPHGLTFSEPVEIVLKQTSGTEPARPAILRLDDESDSSWENVAWPVADATSLHFFTTHFSVLLPAQYSRASCQPPLVMSAVYTMGGQNEFTPDYDFVELHNREAQALVLDGVALQLNDGAASVAWTVIPLNGLVPPRGYYMIRLGRDSVQTGTAVPAGDASSPYNLPSAGGLVALTVGTGPLSTSGPWTIISGVSYGSSSLSLQGTPIAATTQPTQMLRNLANGCTWTNNNSADLLSANPKVPFTTASPPVTCSCDP